MKQSFSIAVLLAAATLSSHGAYIYSWNVNSAIPNGNPSGFVNNQTIGMTTQGNNLPTSPIITSVVGVTLNLSGGWNGDLYAYLRHETTGGTGFTTLLNRVGTTTTPFNPIGYTTAGMNVTLIEGAGSGNIHSVPNPTSGGTYQVDSTGSVITFNSFQGLDPNGTWSLFFADLSGGNNTTTLTSWGLTLEVVPEPTTWALGIFGGIGGIVGLVRWCRKTKADTFSKAEN